MKKLNSKYIIIGGGVSGLTSAFRLLQLGETDFIILEGRNRFGGRVLTKNSIDLGPAWFQPNHTYLNQLLGDLDIEKFNQYSKGKSVLIYNTMAPAHYFESDQSQPSAYRISGGTSHLIERLSELVGNKILLNTKVSQILETGNNLQIITNNGEFMAHKVIVTLPPKLAVKLDLQPKLPEDLQQVMLQTHTWMSNAIKVGISFKTPFWREKHFSGTIIGQIGPVVELYDHTNINETKFSLMGFVNEGLRDVSEEDRKERILNYLEKYLGKDIRNYNNYYEKDWSQDPFTSCNNLKSIYMSPKYGHPIFNNLYMNSKLLFSGSETSPLYGGFLEGAVCSGLRAVDIITN